MRASLLILLLTVVITQVHSQDSLYLMATITGERVGDQAGEVEWAGDVNGDGFDDVLVNSSKANYAKLYFGGAPFDTVADLEFATTFACGAGDVNGDGFSDIAFLADCLRTYLGGENGKMTMSNFHFNYPYVPALIGKIGGVGDLNSDGYDDLAFSSTYNWWDGLGRVCLFWGGAHLDTIPAKVFVGDQAGQFWGGAICGGGDINCDGFDDLIIGSVYCASNMDTNAFKIFYGGVDMDTAPDATMTQAGLCEYALSNTGDTNGDGFDDFLVSTGSGACLYLGIDSVIVIRNSTIGLIRTTRHAVGGDINNDGYNDFLVSNSGFRNASGEMVGQIRGYYGSANPDTLCDFTMEGESHWGGYSTYLCIPGDINGDGFDEVIVGAPKSPNYQTANGKVYIYSYGFTDRIIHHKKLNPVEKFHLLNNYPNPFNAATRIEFSLDQGSHISLVIFNCLGKPLQTLVDGRFEKGHHSIVWNARGAPSGIYFCQITTAKYSKTIKLLLVR